MKLEKLEIAKILRRDSNTLCDTWPMIISEEVPSRLLLDWMPGITVMQTIYIPITYIVWWYTTLYQVEHVVWTRPGSLRVAIATSCDAVSSRNRQDLMQSLVPPHYVCNGYLLSFCFVCICISSIQLDFA